MKVKEAEEMIRVRISTVMRQKRITPSILARKTGISESVIRGYIQEGVVPTAGRLAVICEALKLDIAWVCGLRAGRRIKMSDYDISMCNFNVTTFDPLLGKLLVKIEGAEEGSGEIRFVLDNGDMPTLTQPNDPTYPCDLCVYNPPSSLDGKPCTFCPATSRPPEGEA